MYIFLDSNIAIPNIATPDRGTNHLAVASPEQKELTAILLTVITNFVRKKQREKKEVQENKLKLSKRYTFLGYLQKIFGLKRTNRKFQTLKEKAGFRLQSFLKMLPRLTMQLAFCLALEILVGQFPFLGAGVKKLLDIFSCLRRLSFLVSAINFGLELTKYIKKINFRSMSKDLKVWLKKSAQLDKKKIAYLTILAMGVYSHEGYDWASIKKNGGTIKNMAHKLSLSKKKIMRGFCQSKLNIISKNNRSFRTPSPEELGRDEYAKITTQILIIVACLACPRDLVYFVYDKFLRPCAAALVQEYYYKGGKFFQGNWLQSFYQIVVVPVSMLCVTDGFVGYLIDTMRFSMWLTGLYLTPGLCFQLVGLLEIIGLSKVPGLRCFLYHLSYLLFQFNFSTDIKLASKLDMQKFQIRPSPIRALPLNAGQKLSQLIQMHAWQEKLDVGAGVPTLYVIPIDKVLAGFPIQLTDWLPIRYLDLGAEASGAMPTRHFYKIWGDSLAVRTWKHSVYDIYSKKRY